MIHSDHPKFIYIHIAKAGGSSITKTLAKYLGQPREVWRPEQYKFLHASVLPRMVKNIDQYFVFSVVRNPWSRVVSFFHYLQQVSKSHHKLPMEKTFSEWLLEVEPVLLSKVRPQINQICDKKGNIHECITYLGKLENITQDWKNICGGMGIDIELLHDKKTIHKPYIEYYDPKLKDIVYRLYKQDIRKFEYEFGQ